MSSSSFFDASLLSTQIRQDKSTIFTLLPIQTMLYPTTHDRDDNNHNNTTTPHHKKLIAYTNELYKLQFRYHNTLL
eukprot:UN08269